MAGMGLGGGHWGCFWFNEAGEREVSVFKYICTWDLL